jgi:hypothetical protein
MKTSPLRNKVVVAVGLSVIALSGVIVYAAVTPTILGVGTTPHSEVLGGPATVTFRNLLTTPGDVGAWHYHPGKMVNIVKRGSVTVGMDVAERPPTAPDKLSKRQVGAFIER